MAERELDDAGQPRGRSGGAAGRGATRPTGTPHSGPRAGVGELPARRRRRRRRPASRATRPAAGAARRRPRTSSATISTMPAARSRCCRREASGRPVASRSLNSSFGRRQDGGPRGHHDPPVVEGHSDDPDGHRDRPAPPCGPRRAATDLVAGDGVSAPGPDRLGGAGGPLPCGRAPCGQDACGQAPVSLPHLRTSSPPARPPRAGVGSPDLERPFGQPELEALHGRLRPAPSGVVAAPSVTNRGTKCSTVGWAYGIPGARSR